MKAYLAGPIFTQRDMDWNVKIAAAVRAAYPGIDLYLAQENKAINDKTKFADSKAIFDGDFARLKEADMLIATISGDMPPIGTTCEVAIFSQMIQDSPSSGKRMICIYDDTRDMTINGEKASFAATNIAENQTCYTNLLLIGAAKRSGIIVRDIQQLQEYIVCLYTEDCKKLSCSGIYCFTNRMNGKKYIGQSNNINRRLKEHWNLKGISHNSALDLAIQKYGPSYFTTEILEFCPEEELNDREIYWINYYNSIAPNGYNIAPGGSYTISPDRLKMISCYDIDGNKIATFKSIIEAAKHYNLVDTTLSFCCQQKEGYRSCGGMFWRYGDEEHIELSKPKTGKMAKKTVYCYDKDSKKFLAEYTSAVEVCRALGLKDNSMTNIRACCRGKNYYAYGYIWSDIKWDKAPDNFKQINYENYLALIEGWQ